MTRLHKQSEIGQAKIKLLEYDGGYWACDYDEPMIGMTLALGDETKARSEFCKVSKLAPCQLYYYLTHRTAF